MGLANAMVVVTNQELQTPRQALWLTACGNSPKMATLQEPTHIAILARWHASAYARQARHHRIITRAFSAHHLISCRTQSFTTLTHFVC